MSDAGTVPDREPATRVVVSYDPSEFDGVSRFWMENELGSDDYAAYLRRAHESASEGETWDEFVSKGCSLPMDVTLRVERVEGGSALGPDTDVEIHPRN